MRLGFGLPQVGPAAGPDALVRVARRAEELGYDDVWTFDRLLWPLAPRTPYPASADGKLPELSKTVLDPLEALTFVAAHTQRVGLATSVLNLPFYNPVLLARRLTTLDVLSRGRLQVGFGNGWSADEFEAAGAPMKVNGKRTDEALRLIKTIWTTDPVEFAGEHYRVPRSVIYPKPVQQPHPPIYLAAFSQTTMRRVAQEANGWLPAGLPIGRMQEMFASIKDMARAADRDPSTLQLIVRANVFLSAKPLGAQRAAFAGTPEQLRDDIHATRAAGADELHFDVQFSPGVTSEDAMVDRMEQLWELAHQ